MDQSNIKDLNKESLRNSGSTSQSQEINQVVLGTRFNIGRPAKGEYEHLSISPMADQSGISQLLPVNDLESKMVITRGILKMKKGLTLLCLTRIDGKPFYGNVLKIYANLAASIRDKELIHL